MQTLVNEGPVLVAKAETDFAGLPGIAEFCKRMEGPLQGARIKNAEGVIAAWNVMRCCYEYGNRADVQAKVSVMNVMPDGRKKVGRPHTGHRLAMEALAEKLKCSIRTLGNWQIRWLEAAAKLELPLHTGEKELMAMIAINSKRLPDWLEELDQKESPADAEAAEKDKKTFKDVITHLLQKLDRAHTEVGEVAFRKKSNLVALSDALESWCENHGIVAEITFKA